jgi:mRNA interferase MazF
MEYIKNFDNWNEKKKDLDERTNLPPYFKEKEIWWLSIGVNVGFEEDGKDSNFVRPVLVIKKFNRDIFLGVPLSTKIKNNIYYVKITHQNRKVSAMISQIKTFSSKRILNKIGELDYEDFESVMVRIKELIILPLSR